MSMKDKFKTDAQLANDGVWVTYEKNSDGTIPAIKLARASKQNKKFQQAARKLQEATGEAADEEYITLFADCVVLDWRNMQPEDDGVVLPYSKEAAAKLLCDPNWSDLFDDIVDKSHSTAAFREATLAGQAKNS